MTQTALTQIQINGGKVTGLRYANDEMAWLRGDLVSSVTTNSTAIRYWSYDVVTKKLTVQYHSGDKFYDYEGVPYAVTVEMMFADSLGAFIAKRIKPVYSVEV